MEPDANTVSAVENFNQAGGGVPAPAPDPTPTPAPAQTPAPVEPAPAAPAEPVDPFTSLFAQEPSQPAPTEPAAPASTPTEPAAPVPEPSQPVEPTPAPNPEPAPTPEPEAPKYETYEEYVARVTQGLPKEPEQPDPSKINPDDPAAIKKFFDDLVNTAVQKATAQTQRSAAIQTSERKLWDAAFEKYGSLRTNKDLRDMVHSIRMSNFHKGIALTPTQAADKLLSALKSQYKQGMADNQVVTSIEAVQPNAGGGTPVATSLDKDSVLSAVQTGGETALASHLDQMIKDGKL